MLKIAKFTDVCMTGGMHYTPSHTNVCKLYNFQLTFSQLILLLAYSNVFEFSAVILEKGLLLRNSSKRNGKRVKKIHKVIGS